MKLQELREMARKMEIPVKKMNKAELTRAIQEKEGNTPCFDTGAAAECGQFQCIWRDDCT